MQKIKDFVTTFHKENYHRFFLVCWICMIFLYFSMMAHGLVNQWDGIWEYDYYMAGKWSISIGRIFWPFLDRLKMGIAAEPLATVTSLALYCLGITLAIYFINDKKKFSGRSLLCAFTFLSSASICISLSYRFMSATFGLAFLLSVLAVILLSEIEKPVLAVIISGIFIAGQMGLYQAYLGCTAFMIIVWILRDILNQKGAFKDTMIKIIKFACAMLLGGALYYVALKVILLVTHTSMESYKGADDYSVLNVFANLGLTLTKTYEVFRLYFFSLNYRISLIMKVPAVYYVGIIVTFAAVIIGFIACLVIRCKKDIKSMIVGIVLFLLIPLSANIVLLVATNADTSLQMTVPMAMVLPMLICLISNVLCLAKSSPANDEKSKKAEKQGACDWCLYITLIIVAFLLYGSVMQVHVDQEAMKCGMESVSTIANGMLHKLDDECCLSAEKPVCFVGVPAGNELYHLSKACDGANYYSLFGSWGGWSDSASWGGVYHNLLNVNINVADNGQYDYIKAMPEIAEMPCYPKEGCIKEIDGIVVIKVSDAY